MQFLCVKGVEKLVTWWSYWLSCDTFKCKPEFSQKWYTFYGALFCNMYANAIWIRLKRLLFLLKENFNWIQSAIAKIAISLATRSPGSSKLFDFSHQFVCLLKFWTKIDLMHFAVIEVFSLIAFTQKLNMFSKITTNLNFVWNWQITHQ